MSHLYKRKKFKPHKWFELFWSEWHDLNVRPLGPEDRNACKIKAFPCFLVLSCRNKNLFRTFRHTVSAQSKAVDGQRCGQINIYPQNDGLKSFKTLRLLQPLYHKNSKTSRDMAQNLHRCNQRLPISWLIGTDSKVPKINPKVPIWHFGNGKSVIKCFQSIKSEFQSLILILWNCAKRFLPFVLNL